jgi:cobalt transporter subunit CbtA
MTYRMLAGGLIAGFAAGLIAALLHFAFIQNLILLGEQYETGAVVHFGGAGAGGAEAGHAHATDEGAHVHAAAPREDADSAVTRNLLTILFTGLTYAAYGLLIVAGFALAERFGHRIKAHRGLLWGLAGFATFQLAPAMGLAPELPGSVAADLSARQAWWLGTVLATGTGLALLGYGRTLLTALLGGALLAAPHVIGAPHLDGFHGVAPPELAAAFSANVLGVGFATWAILGWLAARLWVRSRP